MENEDYSFDEIRARKVVTSLLKKDAIIYRKLIPEIEKLDSESLENLFNGEAEYHYNIKNQNFLKKLLIKIDNFLYILSSWYKDDKYYKYLEELWLKYPSIEDLKVLETEKELADRLQSYSINYTYWPKDIKESFKNCIDQTVGTKVMELKKQLEVNFSQVSNVVSELKLLKSKFKETKEELYEKNAENIALKIISITIMAGSIFANNAIEDKKVRAVKKLVSKKCFTSPKENELFSKRILKAIKEKKLTGNYNFYDNKRRLHELNIKCKNGKLDNINLGQKVRAVFKSQYICGLHAALSFINLGWSIYELTQTYKGFEEVKNYKMKLEECKSLFEMHKNEIGLLPDDFMLAAERIKNVINKIRQDQQRLRNLINDIRKSIAIEESQKNKSIGGLAASIGLGAFGIIGGIISCNGVSVMYGISTAMNIVSGVAHTTNIVMSSKIISQLNQILDEAYKEEEKIQKEIDSLYEELTERIKQEPKFELDKIMSSLSTEIYE